MLGQGDDILAARAERRDLDGKYAEPIEEIAAEPPRLHLGREIAVGRRDDADVDAARAIITHPLKLAVLEHPKELRLQLERDLAGLVQEQRAAVRELEAPEPILMRARERAPHMPEELALEELLGYRRAVHLHERPCGPIALGVNGAGDELLADARLAVHEHRRPRASHSADELQDARHTEALAHDTRAALDLTTCSPLAAAVIGQPASSTDPSRIEAPETPGADHSEERVIRSRASSKSTI